MGKVKETYAQMNPVLKGIFWVVGGLLILLIILQILVSLFADDYAANYLTQKVRESSDSTYTITFDDLDLSIFRGAATLTNVQLHSDTTAFTDTSSSKKPAKVLYSGNLGELDVSGINVFSAAWGKELHIGSITLNKPDIQALQNPREIAADTSSRFSSVDSSIYAAISNRYQALEIDDITINQGHALFSQQADTLYYLGNLNLTLQNMRVDSASARSGRTFITDDIAIEAREFMNNLSDNINKVRFDALRVSSDEQTITLDSLQVIPRYPRFEYGRRNGTKKDRIELDVPEIKFHGVDFAQFNDSSKIYVQYGTVNDARLVDFLNRAITPGPPKPKDLPFTTFRNLKQHIKIDSLKINNAFISYSEYMGEAPQAGTITFEQLNASLYDISNYPEDINTGLATVMDVQTRVMGNGMLSTHFEFPLDTENSFHTIKGTLGKMPITGFNPILQYVAFVRIDTGMMNSLEFDMTLNDDHSNGTVIMKYEDLKISVLDKKSVKQEGIMENLKTFLANNFIVKKNNTPEDGMQAGQVDFERIKHKSIFNYWWKSLLSGIKGSIKK